MEFIQTVGAGFAAGIGVAGFIFGFTKKWRQDDTKQHNDLDDTNAKLVKAYKDRIDFLEMQANESGRRISVLERKNNEDRKQWEKERAEMLLTIKGIYSKNKEFLDLLALRDPIVAKVIEESGAALVKFNGETAPKVDQLHEHFLGKEAR